MKRIAVIGVASVALLVSACGHTKSAMSTDASRTLQANVAAIRASASAHDAAAVAIELADLRTRVSQFQADGAISASAAQRILAAATTVEQNLPLITTTTTTAPAQTGRGHGNDQRDQGGD